MTGKFRGADHRSCNINRNLRGYDSHLIFSELDKFHIKSIVIPNVLEKYMTFFK